MTEKEISDKNNTLISLQSILISRATGGVPAHADYQVLRGIAMRWYYEHETQLSSIFPTLILNHRDLNSFWSEMKHKFKSYQERRQYIYANFDPILKFLEKQKYNRISIITPRIVLSNNYILDLIKKAHNRISQGDNEGAITVARTLVENIQVEIYKNLHGGEFPDYKGDLITLYGMIKKDLNLSIDKKMDERFKLILSGLNSILNGIANLRNAMGDSHARKIIPSAHHARLAVNCAFTFSQFLCDTFEYQKKGSL